MEMNSHLSAFIARIEKFADLTSSERAVLQRLEENPLPRKKRTQVFSPHVPEDRIAIIAAGWAVSRATSSRGQSTITQIYLPGDMVGLSDIGFAAPPHDVFMQTDGAVCLINRSTLSELGRDHPRLFSLFVAVSSLEEISLRDRLHAISRLTAEERLIHFMLSIKSRTSLISDRPNDRFPLHLSQKDIGDALGLTDIYVNRLLRKMSKGGEIAVTRPYFRINDRDGWAKRVGYKDRHSDLDISWFETAS